MGRRPITASTDVTNLSEQDAKKARKREQDRERQRRKRQRDDKIKEIAAAEGRKIDFAANNSVFMSKHKYDLLDSFGERDFRMIFLLASRDSHHPEKHWFLHERTLREGNSVLNDKRYDSLREAEEAYELLKTGNRPKDLDWRGVEFYYPQAKAFIDSHSAGGDKSRDPVLELGFLFALDELQENGFKRKDGSERLPGRNLGRDAIDRRKQFRRNTLKIVRNQPLETRDFDEQYRHMCITLAKGCKTESTFFALLWWLNKAIAQMQLKPAVFKIVWPEVTAKGIVKQVSNDYRRSATGNGHLRRKKSFGYIPVDKLNDIFVAMLNEQSINMLTLSLSTGLRPGEIRRLVQKSSPHYVLNGSHLNYKGRKIENEKLFLVSKTDAKGDVELLENPMLSIVSRVILNNDMPCSWLPENPFHNESTFRKGPLAKDCFTKTPERHIRASCATMLAYCDLLDSAKSGRATRDMAAQRLGHIDTKQVVSTYAPKIPSETPNPADYFGLSGLSLDGEQVSEYSTLWDVYLLFRWLSWYKKNKLGYYPHLKNLVKKEARAFQNMFVREQKRRLSVVEL